MKCTRALAAVLVAASQLCTADDTPDIPIRFDSYRVDYQLNADGSDIEHREWAMTVLKERALEDAKTYAITYSTSVEKAEVIKAYTRKHDGRRIDVPKDNFQLKVNKGRGANSPVFSDMTTLTVVFPDLDVGDTVVLGYRVTQLEPMFPGKFSTSGRFPRNYRYDDVMVRIDMPESLWAQYQARDMEEHLETKAGRKIIEWRYANPHPVKSERSNFSVYDIESEPGYAFSTFRSYAEIAEAYGARAREKARVTERVRKLAAEIAQEKNTPFAQARALYDWVTTNITYAGNCIGVGAVVPHDIDFILDNRMGDCKDHATLLQALLAARGVESTQALVNAGSVYRLPRIPMVSTINHVITYIPSLDLYADSTAQIIPFGMLPFPVADKEVLLVDGYREGVRTPTQKIGENRQYMKMVAKVGEDGAISGTAEIALKGLYAATIRAWAREMPKDRGKDLVRDSFSRRGHIGSGSLEMGDARELLDSYQYKVEFEMKDFVRRPGAGAFTISPLVFSIAPIEKFLQEAVMPVEEVDVACSSGISTEEYVFELPGNMNILSMPDNIAIANDFLTYQSDYSLEDNTLTVKRVFDDRTRGNVCKPELFKVYKEFAMKALTDARAQVLYK